MDKNSDVRFTEIDLNIEVGGNFCGASIPRLAPNSTATAVGLVVRGGHGLFHSCRTHRMLT
jgi:hypothetical protein